MVKYEDMLANNKDYTELLSVDEFCEILRKHRLNPPKSSVSDFFTYFMNLCTDSSFSYSK